ncbi:MAG: NAD+ synthase [Bacillota bacterium]|nr:NAD+ synthase [Bacillota bacterium]
MKVCIAQLNPTVGDIEGNKRRLIETLAHLDAGGRIRADVDLVVFPELFLVGYPPRDLLEREWFVEACERAVDEIRRASVRFPGMGVLFGAPLQSTTPSGKGLHNCAVLVCGGELVAVQAKSLLPTYDVFDEARYFDPALEIKPVPFKGEMLGISVCEDAWNDPDFWPKRRMYDLDPIEVLARAGATLHVNISASPFHAGKDAQRYRLISNHARRHGAPFLYVNQVGANDELIFDGRSLAVDAAGRPIAVCPAFTEHVQEVDMSAPGAAAPYTPQDTVESVHDALVLGVRDYMRKTGFTRAVVGLSGGIDSALTCCIAVRALGAENVLGISMPSPYSSRGSVEDSRKLAENLGIEFKVIPISSIYASYLDALAPHFAGAEPDITEENIQARIRGNILMAFSNKFGHLVLSTGNKSELAVGYCTLYGDMSGGLAVLADVPKTMVYELARYVNRESEVIPEAIIRKAPSAELRPNQTDQDTLPPYEVLDAILHGYIEEGESPEDLVRRGFPTETVEWVVRAVRRNEYKRRQAAPGLKVTSKAFGVGRRMPIAARYCG